VSPRQVVALGTGARGRGCGHRRRRRWWYREGHTAGAHDAAPVVVDWTNPITLGFGREGGQRGGGGGADSSRVSRQDWTMRSQCTEVDGGVERRAGGGGLSVQPRTPAASQERQRVRVGKEAGGDSIDAEDVDGARKHWKDREERDTEYCGHR
jgi:hypothetical protein